MYFACIFHGCSCILETLWSKIFWRSFGVVLITTTQLVTHEQALARMPANHSVRDTKPRDPVRSDWTDFHGFFMHLFSCIFVAFLLHISCELVLQGDNHPLQGNACSPFLLKFSENRGNYHTRCCPIKMPIVCHAFLLHSYAFFMHFCFHATNAGATKGGRPYDGDKSRRRCDIATIDSIHSDEPCATIDSLINASTLSNQYSTQRACVSHCDATN
jgi:hypothetical protein